MSIVEYTFKLVTTDGTYVTEFVNEITSEAGTREVSEWMRERAEEYLTTQHAARLCEVYRTDYMHSCEDPEPVRVVTLT